MSSEAAKRRARQTVNNLVLSLIATIGLVIVIVLVVPRDNSSLIPKVDYASVALNASNSSGLTVVAPALPEGWWANKATWLPNPTDTVPAFKAGFVGPNNQYIGETMGFGANPTWLALQLQGSLQTGTYAAKWQIFETQVERDTPATMDYVMVRNLGNDYILLYGTAPQSDFETLANSIDNKLQEVRPNE